MEEKHRSGRRGAQKGGRECWQESKEGDIGIDILCFFIFIIIFFLLLDIRRYVQKKRSDDVDLRLSFALMYRV